ncbi:hypothetical protein GCM10023196_079520 [Actinoallomurus vinaceus]|uniref:Uncharacterized protein n=1 Tax=Actinoallomurus vinaceus TaxID=1080074 RepID=A0ABP8UML7_9ACTN
MQWVDDVSRLAKWASSEPYQYIENRILRSPPDGLKEHLIDYGHAYKQPSLPQLPREHCTDLC